VFDEDDLGDVVSISVLGSDDPLCGCGDLACPGCPEGAGEAPGAGLPSGGLAERMLDRPPAMVDSGAADGPAEAGLASRMVSVGHHTPFPPPRPRDGAAVTVEDAALDEPAVEEASIEEIVMVPKPPRAATAGWTYQPRPAAEVAAIELHARLVHARRRLRSLAPRGAGAGGQGDAVMEIPKQRAPSPNVPSL
jgi:hypothetical protein